MTTHVSHNCSFPYTFLLTNLLQERKLIICKNFSLSFGFGETLSLMFAILAQFDFMGQGPKIGQQCRTLECANFLQSIVKNLSKVVALFFNCDVLGGDIWISLPQEARFKKKSNVAFSKSSKC